MKLKQCGWLLSALVGLALSASQVSANLLVNPGFESPITSDGPPFVGFWEAFNGSAGASAAISTIMPRTGVRHIDGTISNTNNTFAGVFQDVEGLVPGQTGFWSVWQKRTTLLDLQVEMRIEWRNAGQAVEIARTQNIVPTSSITDQYQNFTMSGVVPAGADTARVVWAIQTFSGGPANSGTVFVDDASFVVVPEPATFGLLAAALAPLLGMRRKREA